MSAQVEILHGDGSIETHSIEGPATIGRALEADIPIPDARDLAPEHLQLFPEPDGVRVELKDQAAAPAYVGGKVFQGGRLPWGAELSVGGLRFRVLPKKHSRGAGLGSIFALIAI